MATIPMGNSGTSIPTDKDVQSALRKIKAHDFDQWVDLADEYDEAIAMNDVKTCDRLAVEIVGIASTLIPQAAKPAPKVAKAPAVPVPPRNLNNPKRVLGIAALLFGLTLWIPGAHYQLDGWTMIANKVLSMIRSGYAFPLATGWYALLLIPFGVIYSIGERMFIPLRRQGDKWSFLGAGVLLTWLLVNGSDLGSAWLGIANPGEGASQIALWTAATPWATVAWMVVVVYIGDILIALGWKWLNVRGMLRDFWNKRW